MSFDIPEMHVPDNSDEARLLENIISRDNVTVEEAVRRAIRTLAINPYAPIEAMTIRKPKQTAPGVDEELKIQRTLPRFGLTR